MELGTEKATMALGKQGIDLCAIYCCLPRRRASSKPLQDPGALHSLTLWQRFYERLLRQERSTKKVRHLVSSVSYYDVCGCTIGLPEGPIRIYGLPLMASPAPQCSHKIKLQLTMMEKLQVISGKTNATEGVKVCVAHGLIRI